MYSKKEEFNSKDPAFEKELQYYADEITVVIKNMVGAWNSSFEEDTFIYYNGVKQEDIHSISDLSDLASRILYEAYPQTLIVNNELINKNTVSGSIMAAKRNVLNGMIRGELPGQYYGVQTLSPDYLAVRSVLVKNGFVETDEAVDENEFLGIRHSESRERKGYERTQDHSKIGTQINAMPIIEWDDCDVWLYLLAKDVRFNEAYLWGYKRVGCWCCPNNSDWSTMLTDIYFPDLASRWRAVLYGFAEKTNKTDIDDYVENGKWKTRKGASGLVARNVAIADTPCNLSDRARNIIIQKKIQRDVLEFIKPFGELSIFDKEDATYITVTERAGNMIAEDGKEISFPRRKVCDLVITWGTPVLKVLPTKNSAKK